MGVAADLARQTDPTMAAKYRRLVVERKLNHNSAVCHLAAVLATRILACLSAGSPYQIRGLDGQAITAAQGRVLCQGLRVQPHERPRPPRRQRKAGLRHQTLGPGWHLLPSYVLKDWAAAWRSPGATQSNESRIAACLVLG
jgi:hypothetical protein